MVSSMGLGSHTQATKLSGWQSSGSTDSEKGLSVPDVSSLETALLGWGLGKGLRSGMMGLMTGGKRAGPSGVSERMLAVVVRVGAVRR